MDDIRDPSSSAYRRARRRHIKTTRNRPVDVEQDWSPFRAAEKRYKARFPLPDLSHVLDLANLTDSRTEECARGGWRGCSHAVQWNEIHLDDSEGRKGYIIPRIPGLVLLPAFVPQDKQRSLVRVSLRDQACHPNETNLDTHYDLPVEGLWRTFLSSQKKSAEPLIQPRMSDTHAKSDPSGPRKLINNVSASPNTFSALSSAPKPPPAPSTAAKPAPPSVLLKKLRWANIGWSYHWGSKQYDFGRGRGEVRAEYRDLCKEAVKAVRWEEVFGEICCQKEWDGDDWRTWHDTYEPDAGIVNFYQTKDTLMAHVDRSEVCSTSPLVSISLGNAAVFLIGGLTRDVEPVAILLRSGDVVIMSGPACRRAYHGIPRILENTLPPHLECNGDSDDEWPYYEDYLRDGRINVNVRQVFPKGFEPSLV